MQRETEPRLVWVGWAVGFVKLGSFCTAALPSGRKKGQEMDPESLLATNPASLCGYPVGGKEEGEKNRVLTRSVSIPPLPALVAALLNLKRMGCLFAICVCGWFVGWMD